ncbi:hypothetical protein CN947_18930 [Bacillus cereus]|nr:hypothetical protein CN947_18930 [Bacillus cereus]
MGKGLLIKKHICIDFTGSNGERMTEYVEFDDEIIVDEETRERYVICWLPDSELFELADLPLCMWNK